MTLFLGGILSINAQTVQTMVLKNGSELDGYISMQKPGENFCFTTQKAQIFLFGKNVKSIVDKEFKINDLSDDWKKWAEENDAFTGIGDSRSLVLSDIITVDGPVNKVRILERGVKIKYLEMGNNSYLLSWDTISVVKAKKRISTLLTGINRVYKLSSGMEYEGQYVEEVPGKTLSLYRDNGVVEVFETKDVVKDNRKKVNPNQTLLEQSELLDIVRLNNGSSYEGIIFERNYSDSKSGNYLLIQLEDESIQSVRLDEIVEYGKKVNSKYHPIYDIILHKNDIVINRMEGKKQEVVEEDNMIILESELNPIVIQKGADVIVETYLENEKESLKYKVVEIKKYQGKKKKTYMGFSFEKLVKESIQPVSIETSVNHTTKITYQISKEGMYALFDPQSMTVIPFKIN